MIRSILIFVYIAAVLLVSGLAKAGTDSTSPARVMGSPALDENLID